MNKLMDQTPLSGRRGLAPDLARGCILLLITMAYTNAHLSDPGAHASERAQHSMADFLAVWTTKTYGDPENLRTASAITPSTNNTIL